MWQTPLSLLPLHSRSFRVLVQSQIIYKAQNHKLHVYLKQCNHPLSVDPQFGLVKNSPLRFFSQYEVGRHTIDTVYVQKAGLDFQWAHMQTPWEDRHEQRGRPARKKADGHNEEHWETWRMCQWRGLTVLFFTEVRHSWHRDTRSNHIVGITSLLLCQPLIALPSSFLPAWPLPLH